MLIGSKLFLLLLVFKIYLEFHILFPLISVSLLDEI